MPTPTPARHPRHFLTITETPAERVAAILRRAIALRARPEPTLLAGKTLLCLFEKPSLRTRVSFEGAMRRLGGHAMSMGEGEVGLGGREAPGDVARVLSGMVDAVMARVKRHGTLEALAAHSAVPVINGLSDQAHPAQALADALTIIDEFSPGDAPPSPDAVKGRTVVFVGDGNNVARSLAAVCAALGMRFVMCAPKGYGLDDAWAARVRGAFPGAEIASTDDPAAAVRGADVIACDTFVSMGQEAERDERLRTFRPYQVNEALLAQAPPHAIVLHCLPAARGVEITDAVMDGPQSRVFPQAHNRLHAQAGLLAELLT